MKKTNAVLLPKVAPLLADMGEDIKLARLRRKLTTEQVSERAGISRSTLWQVEKGESNISMGIYAQVLFVLGLEKDLSQISSNDILGRKLQDAELLVSKRASKNKKAAE